MAQHVSVHSHRVSSAFWKGLVLSYPEPTTSPGASNCHIVENRRDVNKDKQKHYKTYS